MSTGVGRTVLDGKSGGRRKIMEKKIMINGRRRQDNSMKIFYICRHFSAMPTTNIMRRLSITTYFM